MMRTNRYLNVVLTVIAIELGWIGLNHVGTPVSAQQTAQPVVITGVQMSQADMLPVTVRGVNLRNRNEFLPTGLYGQVEQVPGADRFEPIDIRAPLPIKVEVDRLDRPLTIVEPVTVRIPVTSSPEFAK
jgi:hypothetical protein